MWGGNRKVIDSLKMQPIMCSTAKPFSRTQRLTKWPLIVSCLPILALPVHAREVSSK